MTDSFEYGGQIYRRYPKSKHASQRRYFRRYLPKGGGVVLLHRQMWIDANGPIPKGFHVHHKDHDYRNNALANFELSPAGAHFASHPERIKRIRRYAGKGVFMVRVKRRLKRLFGR